MELCKSCEIICPIVNKDQCPLNILIKRAEELSEKAKLHDQGYLTLEELMKLEI